MKKTRGRNRFHQGRYRVQNPTKYLGDLNRIEYRSSWELFFMRWLDLNPNVIKWNSEGVKVDYFSKMDNKARRYFIDFYVKYKDGAEFLYEIKPHKQIQPPKLPNGKSKKAIKRFEKEKYDFNVNLDKWVMAYESARLSGMKFKVITEKHLKQLGMEL